MAKTKKTKKKPFAGPAWGADARRPGRKKKPAKRTNSAKKPRKAASKRKNSVTWGGGVTKKKCNTGRKAKKVATKRASVRRKNTGAEDWIPCKAVRFEKDAGGNVTAFIKPAV